MIPEPQRTYVLELLKALGPAADDFVVAGAQAMKFVLERARATRDIDFVLDVVRLRGKKVSIGTMLKELGYAVVEGAQNFQFEKLIPGSQETMRIEFMAPEELKREKDFRVDIEQGVHARACTGGSIAVAESGVHELSGNLPDGSGFTTAIRVTKPHSLVMLKLLALDDRYRNIRGPVEARHDREEARIHAADIVAIVSARIDQARLKHDFEWQFRPDFALGVRCFKVLREYFLESTSPGLLLYEEFLVADKPLDRSARREVIQEVEQVQKIMMSLIPRKEFYALLTAVEDSCDIQRNPRLVEEFLGNLERARTGIESAGALPVLPSAAFGDAFGRGDTFLMSASEAIGQISEVELELIQHHLKGCAMNLRRSEGLRARFPHALSAAAGT